MTLRSSRIALVALAMLAPLFPAFAFQPGGTVEKPALDVRLPATDAARAEWVMRAPTLAQLASGDALRAAIPDLTMYWDGMSGSPAWVAAPPGLALSAPFPGIPEVAARAFLRANATLFGLTPREVDRLRHASTIPGANGWSHVHFAQMMAGLDVFGAVISVTLGPDNAAISAGGSLYGQLDLRVAPTVSAVEAVARAARDVYPDRVFTGVQVETSDGVDQRTVLDRAEFARPIEARLVVFPTQDSARLAWETRIAEPNLYTDYLVLVDAADGSFLYRQNLTLYAEARVITTPLPIPAVEEYAPEFYDRLPIPAAAGQSVGNWIAAPETTLRGNNATGHLRWDTEPPLAEPTANYDYPFATPEAALVNAWWLVNDAHDRFYGLGFDEASGNYQQDNFGKGGVGGDPIQVVMAGGAPRNEAWTSTLLVDGGGATIGLEWWDCLLLRRSRRLRRELQRARRSLRQKRHLPRVHAHRQYAAGGRRNERGVPPRNPVDGHRGGLVRRDGQLLQRAHRDRGPRLRRPELQPERAPQPHLLRLLQGRQSGLRAPRKRDDLGRSAVGPPRVAARPRSFCGSGHIRTSRRPGDEDRGVLADVPRGP